MLDEGSFRPRERYRSCEQTALTLYASRKRFSKGTRITRVQNPASDNRVMSHLMYIHSRVRNSVAQIKPPRRETHPPPRAAREPHGREPSQANARMVRLDQTKQENARVAHALHRERGTVEGACMLSRGTQPADARHPRERELTRESPRSSDVDVWQRARQGKERRPRSPCDVAHRSGGEGCSTWPRDDSREGTCRGFGTVPGGVHQRR